MVILDTLGTIQTVQGAASDLVNAVRDQEGWTLLRDRFSPNARLAKKIAEAHTDWWARMWRQLGENMQRITALEQAAAFDRLTSDPEGAMILANYIAEAQREPLKSRRKLLQHATAGLVDLGLSIPELARIWRVTRELDVEDVLALYRLWLVPLRDKCEATRWELWQQSGAEALQASGAISVTYKSRFGTGTRSELTIGKTGRVLLSGLRTLLANEPRPRGPRP